MSRAHPQSFRAWLMEDVYSLSSTQINLPDPLDDFLIKWGRMNIPDENLYFDEDGGLGRETEPHITVLYGLKEQEPSKELLELLQRTKPFTVRLGKVSLFESEKYDVVKFEVISDDLVELSNAIRVACPNENKFPKYIPHATVAYCKKGTVADLAGQYPFEASPPIPNEFEASEIVFSGAGDSENPKRLRKILPFNRYRKESVGRSFRDFIAGLKRPEQSPTYFSTLPVGATFTTPGAGVTFTKTDPYLDPNSNCVDSNGKSCFISDPDQTVVFPANWTRAEMEAFKGPVAEAVQSGAARAFLAKLQTPNWVVYTESSKYPGGYSYFKRILAPGGAEPRTYTWVVDPREAERFDSQVQAEQAISEFYRFPNPFFGIKVGKLPVQEAESGAARSFLKSIDPWSYQVEEDHDYLKPPAFAGPKGYHALLCWHGKPQGTTRTYEDMSKAEAEAKTYILRFKKLDKVVRYSGSGSEDYNHLWDWFRRAMSVEASAGVRRRAQPPQAESKSPRRLGEGSARDFLKQLHNTMAEPIPAEITVEGDEAAAEAQAMADLRAAIGKQFKVRLVYGYTGDEDIEAEGNFTVRVLPMRHQIISRVLNWNDNFIDPNWMVDVVAGPPEYMNKLVSAMECYVYGRVVKLHLAESLGEAKEGSARDFLKQLRGQNIVCPLAKWPEDKQLIIQTHDRVDVGKRTTIKAWYEAYGRYRVLVMLDHQITEVGPSGVLQLPNGDFRVRQYRRDGTKAERVVHPDEVVIAVHGPARARTNPDIYAVDVLPAKSRLGEAQPGAARAFLSKVEIPKYVVCALHKQDSTAAPLYASVGRDNAWTDWTEDLGRATRFASKEEAQSLIDGKFDSFEQSYNRIGVVTYAYARCHFVRPPQQHESAQNSVEAALERSIGQELPFKLVPVGATFKHEGDVFQRRGTDNQAWNWLKGGWTAIGDNEVVGPVDNQYSPFDKVGFPEDSSVLTRKLGKR